MASPPRRLLADVLAVGAPYPLAIAGGYAVLAHGLVDRPSRGVDVATESPERMEDIASAVRAGLVERGWFVRSLEAEPLSARLVVGDPVSGEECELNVLKEVLWRPPVLTDLGLTLSLEDAVGTKVRALADRGFARDLIDVHAASDRWSRPELEELGRRHARDTFDLADLQARLSGVEWVDDREFALYGVDDDAIAGLRRWAQEWADDIAERLAESEEPPEE
ncbi:nucleotidyl transferase AbiEii/AbiGii toxin family protein [Streptomyces glomeratus]|uniref:Nucleotidyltransferase n=1 Tax=Streptomyces glomeratus TaxID=284452 RepID=A0ABP6LUM2_9ACTN|nr:nucleotidyl transferase AbiEii/AbiGii toxin family protein [Streptomyces glomeratus]MCF1506187.1 nucleotidyl transferase AbiEii/AbiGii toxin family protein [Streptomyces glomeratus]